MNKTNQVNQKSAQKILKLSYSDLLDCELNCDDGMFLIHIKPQLTKRIYKDNLQALTENQELGNFITERYYE